MSNVEISFEITDDNTKRIVQDLEKAIERSLEIIGGKAETYAKQNCPVDTGLLRNSITHAVGGHSAKNASYSSKDGGKSGSYSGTIGKTGDNTVYIGSNVVYAAYNELHHKTKSGFLRKACEDHKDEYKRIFQNELSGV